METLAYLLSPAFNMSGTFPNTTKPEDMTKARSQRPSFRSHAKPHQPSPTLKQNNLGCESMDLLNGVTPVAWHFIF